MIFLVAAAASVALRGEFGELRTPQARVRVHLNSDMRYKEITEGRPWKHYSGREHTAYISRPSSGEGSRGLSAVEARCGLIHTGRTRTFYGHFVRVSGPSGETWLGEHRYSLREALRDVARQLEKDGWSLSAIGLTCDWRETGLSENSGYGYHPQHEGAVFMLEPPPDDVHQN